MNRSRLHIRNGLIVTHEEQFRGDILVEDGVIQAVGAELSAPTAEYEILDAAGRLVLPGGIDPHVHMALPVGGGLVSADDFASGTRAALAGGTTTIIDFVTPGREQPLLEAFAQRRQEAAESLCDYGLHISVTRWRESLPQELAECAAQGISSCKIYLAYGDTIGLAAEELNPVMRACAQHGILVLAHCEVGTEVERLQEELIAAGKTEPRYHAASRPPALEADAIVHAAQVARKAGARFYVVHVSSAAGMQVIDAARATGQKIAAEVCLHHLVFDESAYLGSREEAARFVMSPPLRRAQDVDALWRALLEGSVDTLATDHCPFHSAQRRARGLDDFRRIPNGVGGVSHRMILLFTLGVVHRKLPLPRFVQLTSTNAARLMGLFPRKGCVTPGADADLLIWNPDVKSVISMSGNQQKCDTDIYEGIEVQGVPEIVVQRGRIVVRDGQVLAQTGDGERLHRITKVPTK